MNAIGTREQQLRALRERKITRKPAAPAKPKETTMERPAMKEPASDFAPVPAPKAKPKKKVKAKPAKKAAPAKQGKPPARAKGEKAVRPGFEARTRCRASKAAGRLHQRAGARSYRLARYLDAPAGARRRAETQEGEGRGPNRLSGGLTRRRSGLLGPGALLSRYGGRRCGLFLFGPIRSRLGKTLAGGL